VSEQERLAHAAAQGGDGAVAAAYADRESRLAADEASLQAGRAPGHDEQLTHHEGRPTVAEQMQTHGQTPPRTPDTGGHG
jgi:hypothetical protein